LNYKNQRNMKKLLVLGAFLAIGFLANAQTPAVAKPEPANAVQVDEATPTVAPAATPAAVKTKECTTKTKSCCSEAKAAACAGHEKKSCCSSKTTTTSATPAVAPTPVIAPAVPVPATPAPKAN